jgi:hypothetical protein
MLKVIVTARQKVLERVKEVMSRDQTVIRRRKAGRSKS